MGINPKGRDWGDLVNWDDLGKFYAGFIISWTIILYSGVAWLFWKRNLLFIKIRNLPLAVAAVSFLHVYLVKIALAYTTNGHFSCGAEFWIMSIYLPFGIALFQANLAQLRSISERQRKLIDESSTISDDSQVGKFGRLRIQWQNISYLHKTYVFIGIGMAIQLLITGILYGTTPTLRGHWASYGPISHAKAQAKCRKSPVWTPSAFWQLFYAYCYGPYLLFKIRNIHDIHSWRLQVILSVLSALPGTPLWLASVFSTDYSTAFKNVNRWWVPPMWLAPGIIVMQFVTIFFPVYEGIKSHKEMRTTLLIIKDWEESRRHLRSSSSGNRDSEKRSSFSEDSNVSSTRQAQMHTMAGLEKALAVNPAPLLRFAATKDFTAENITFLLQVRQWRNAYSNTPKGIDGDVSHWALESLFAAATDIYVAAISEHTAEFPVNLESRIRTDLDNVFSRAIPSRSTRVHFEAKIDPAGASMFAKPAPRPTYLRTVSREYSSSGSSGDTLHCATTHIAAKQLPDEPTLAELKKDLAQETTEYPHHPGVNPLGKARAKIPNNFDHHVFDAAEKSIKYLVLTNTWQKFVRSASPASSVHGGQPRQSGNYNDENSSAA